VVGCSAKIGRKTAMTIEIVMKKRTMWTVKVKRRSISIDSGDCKEIISASEKD
jgi:hypothetical protein